MSRQVEFIYGTMARLRSLFRGVAHRDDVESEIYVELQHHIEMRAADLVRTGLCGHVL